MSRKQKRATPITSFEKGRRMKNRLLLLPERRGVRPIGAGPSLLFLA